MSLLEEVLPAFDVRPVAVHIYGGWRFISDRPCHPIFSDMPPESRVFGRRAASKHLQQLRGNGSVSAESATIRKGEKCAYERYESVETRKMETNAKGMR